MSRHATAGTPGSSAARSVEGVERGRLVERGEGRQGPELGHDLRIDPDRHVVAAAAVDDAMTDGVRRAGVGSTAARSASRSARPRTAARSRDQLTRSSASSIRSLRLLEPALTTRTRTGATSRPGSPARSSRGRPGGPRRARGCTPGRQALVGHLLAQAGGARAQPGHAVDHVHDQVEAVQVVEHDHVEGRRGGALLLVAAHVEVVVIGPPVGQAVDEPGVAVVGEDHRPVRR